MNREVIDLKEILERSNKNRLVGIVSFISFLILILVFVIEQEFAIFVFAFSVAVLLIISFIDKRYWDTKYTIIKYLSKKK